jgi:hypothetical protein
VCLSRRGLEEVVQEGVEAPCDVATVAADRDRIHRRTRAIPASREFRKPPALASSSIVSDRLPVLLFLCLKDAEELVVAVDEVVANDGARDAAFSRLLLLLLLLVPPPRLRESEFGRAVIPSGAIGEESDNGCTNVAVIKSFAREASVSSNTKLSAEDGAGSTAPSYTEERGANKRVVTSSEEFPESGSFKALSLSFLPVIPPASEGALLLIC